MGDEQIPYVVELELAAIERCFKKAVMGSNMTRRLGGTVVRIKSTAVAVLHTAVHTVRLHEAEQITDESCEAFAARARGMASNCQLCSLILGRERVSRGPRRPQRQ